MRGVFSFANTVDDRPAGEVNAERENGNAITKYNPKTRKPAAMHASQGRSKRARHNVSSN